MMSAEPPLERQDVQLSGKIFKSVGTTDNKRGVEIRLSSWGKAQTLKR